MKSFLSAPILGLVLAVTLCGLPSSNGSSLRSNTDKDRKHNPWEVQIDLRELQSGTDYNNEEFETDGSDASLLNRLVRAILPLMNNAFQNLIPDPLVIDRAGEFEIGSLNLLFCNPKADMRYNFDAIHGLGSFAIDKLQVILGTEQVQFGCLETLWNAAFDITIASTTNLTVDDVGAGITVSGCLLNYTRGFRGAVSTRKPTMRSRVNLSGALAGRTAIIDFADIARAFQIDYESVDVKVEDVSEDLNAFVQNVTRELTTTMKDELITSVEPTVEPIAREALKQSNQLTYSEFYAINSGFGKNEVRRQTAKFYENTASLLGSAASYLGFGGDDVEEPVPTVAGHYGERK